jgi:Zn-dependent peptidase ImmA (M78 family)
MKPARPRYTRINAEVGRLLTETEVRQPPVPVDRMARAAGAKVVYNDFKDEVSGVLIRRDGTVVIGVDKKQSQERRRFTIAHELAHLLLHDGEEIHVDKLFRVNLRSPSSSKAEDVEEIEANAFAATLLMPLSFLRTDLQGVVLDIDDVARIEGLAKRYRVSTQAMTFRLMNIYAVERTKDS